MAPETAKIRILFIQATPPDWKPLDIGTEQRNLDQALNQALKRDAFEWQVVPAARVNDLLPRLRRYQPHVVHFAGHGSRQGEIILNAPDGKAAHPLSAEDFAATLLLYLEKADPPVRLAVLAGCHTAQAAELLSAAVDCAVGMADDVDDAAMAEVFTPALYRALGDHGRVQDALSEAHQALRNHGWDREADAVQPYVRPGVDVEAVVLTADTRRTLSPLHLDYLRRLFGKPWANVSLADMLEERSEEIRLLDIYVPLQVDFGVVVKTQDHMIKEWWAKQEQVEALKREARRAHLVADNQAMAALLEQSEKLRAWPDLGVGEEGLQQIVNGIQCTITERHSAGQKTEDGEHPWYMEAHDAASVQARFVLLGDPGSGKSSFLRHLALCLAGELRRRHGDDGIPDNASLVALRDWLLDTYTPIYVELRDLVRHAFPALPADPAQPYPLPSCDNFWRYVRQHILADDLAGLLGELQQAFASGEAILLLDGLDEVPQGADTRRQRQIKSLVASLVAAYPSLRIIITGRPHAYRRGDWALDDFGRAELRPLSLNRLHELAVALFAKVEPVNAKQKADEFTDAVKRAGIKPSMRANPLFFTMLVGLWLDPDGEPRDLPQTEAELYRQAVDLLLGLWTRRRAPEPSVIEKLGFDDVPRVRAVLEALACSVQGQSAPDQDTTVFSGGLLADLLYKAGVRVFAEDLLDYLSQHAGILVSSAPQEFHFIHRSFQEHLAACELTHTKPAERIPPVAPERRFPQGLIQRACQQPDLWANVVQLAADELLARERCREFWGLLGGLCRPLVKEQQFAETALLAVQVAERHKLCAQTIPSEPDFDEAEWVSAARKSRPLLLEAAKFILTDLTFAPEQRDIAGKLLGDGPRNKGGKKDQDGPLLWPPPGHDPRPGVGVKNGLPDIKWVKIPDDGEFIYQDDERRTEPTFWIAQYPVTYAQYRAFLEADDGFHDPRWWRGLAALKGLADAPGNQRFKYWNHPAENVSWYDAIAFCRWLTAQVKAKVEVKAEGWEALLPKEVLEGGDWKITLSTEWQWEKAARGRDGRFFPWGGKKLEDYEPGYANIDETASIIGTKIGPHYLQKTSAVGMYPQGASPDGVLDLSGNVWEWCLNEYQNPERAQEDSSANHVLRGGSWHDSVELASALARVDGWHYAHSPSGFGWWWRWRPLSVALASDALISEL